MDRSILFVVNPDSQGGKTGKSWVKTYEKISASLKIPHDFVIAKGIGTGKDATLDGIKDGHNTIISVGGEGSNNEVVNGIYTSGKKDVILGFIRSGTANDYCTMINWPEPLEEQIVLIEKGKTIATPLTKVTGDSVRYCLNVADVGVGATAAYMASVERRLKWIRFNFRYTLLALMAVKKWKNIPIVFRLDDRELTGSLSFFMAGFSAFSGMYKVLPQAEPWGEKMAYTVALDFGKLRMIRTMGTLKKGEHTEEIEGVYMGHASKIEIEAESSLLFEVDGEPFSFDAKKVTLEALVDAMNVISVS